MYGYTAKQIKTKAVIALIVGVVMAVYAIFFQEKGSAGMTQIMLYFVSPLVLAWSVLGFLLNWKKILWGIIKPIPIISYLIEFVKGILIMAPSAFFWALTHPEQ